MITAVNNGEISSVIVYSFSRFARSTTHLLNALQIFKANDTSFVSLTEKVDTQSPIGKAMFVIISAIAQLERDLISERVKNGLANARAKEDMDDRPRANYCSRAGYLIRLYLPQYITLKGADHPWKTQLCS
jgi:DNA invertase Pin-like site-specific DNA recombinase